mmetsp:Transcript_486/g.993  ORF Transcript_486/g.993 Transcript_486/m.993 type:complete len:873 (-) Transcript_486:120-2738(-)
MSAHNLSSYSAHGRFSGSSSHNGETPEDEPGFISSNSVHSRHSPDETVRAGGSSGGGLRSPTSSGPSQSRLPPTSYSRPPAPRAVSPDGGLSAARTAEATKGGRRLDRGGSDRPWRTTHGGEVPSSGGSNGPVDLLDDQHVGTHGSRQNMSSPFENMAADIEQRLAESKARLNHATNASTSSKSSASSSSSRHPRVITPTGADLTRQSSSGLNSRWDKFNDDPNLESDAALATGTAIGLAASSAAERQVRAHGSPDQTGESVMVLPVGSHHGGGRSAGMDNSQHSISSTGSRSLYERSGASGSGSGSGSSSGGLLSKARTSARNLMGSDDSSKSSPIRDASASDRHPLSPHDAVRLQAMQMLQLAGGADDSSDEGSSKMTMSKNPRTGGYSAHPVGQRGHASISGLDLSLSAGEDTADRSSGGGGLGQEVAFEEEPNMAAMVKNSSPSKKGSNWSSRYSVDRHLMFLTGGKDSRDLRSEMDSNTNYSSRQRDGGRSATGMYRASAYDMKSAGSSAGAASTQRDNAHKNKTKVPSTKSRWLDVDLAGRSSLPPPPHPSQTGGNYLVTEEIRRKKRRRLCVGSVLLVSLAAIIGSLYGTTFNSDGSTSLGSSSYWNVGEPVTFYVTGDVPYDQAEEERLSRDITGLPSDAEFVVHLGDVGLASTSSCAKSMYEGASSILKTSSRPVFVLPGNQDWNECPNPEMAFDNWMTSFHKFEDNFSHSFAVTRQLGRQENFSFLHNGVLFIGLHLVDGSIPDRTEWNLRHQDCVQWAEQALNDFGEEQYRAVVILGHARPTALLGDFFWPIIDDLNDVNKPVLYVHGNAMQGWTVYKPFSDASRLKAVELEKGGKSPPVKIRVGMGGDPFRFDRRSSNNA